jgi:DNA processing protein
MELTLFLKTLSLVLQYKHKVSAKRIVSMLRENMFLPQGNNLSYSDVNDFLQLQSPSLPSVSLDDWYFGEKIFNDNLSQGIDIFSINEDRYPKYLKVIKDAPPLLFVKGNNQIFNNLPGAAVVGARKASEAGQEISRRLGKFLAENNWVVVSGLALGIDAAAHKGCLQGNGKTIAVLASGLDKASPLKNAQLGQEILDANGAWVSEHSVGIPAQKHHFVPRNRIQIGLSAGSIIVEAEIKSGSLSQARFCVGQNRPLFAVTPFSNENYLNLNCEGTLHMVDDLGAIPLSSKNDYPKLLDMLKREKGLIV